MWGCVGVGSTPPYSLEVYPGYNTPQVPSLLVQVCHDFTMVTTFGQHEGGLVVVILEVDLDPVLLAQHPHRVQVPLMQAR